MIEASRRFLSTVSASHLRAVLALLVLTLGLYLPGFSAMPPMDRDEPRFAQASRQMLESGDFIDIRFQNEHRFKKPVGIYWLQAASVRAGEALGVRDAPHQIWLYRIPSLIGAILAVLLTYWTALAFMTRRSALLAASLMAACVILTVEARLAKTDAVLLATVMASMGALARAWFSFTDPRTVAKPGLGNALIFWIAIGIGILIKGPITPLIAGVVALGLSLRERNGRWLGVLRPGIGLLIVLALVLPWIVAIVLRSGGDFFREAIGNDMLGKVASAKERHGAPPGTYLGVFWATAWPLAPFLALSVPFLRREWRDDAVVFLLLWIVPVWIMFEAIPTKLPHYVMPLYPPMAILVVMALDRGALECRRNWHKIFPVLLALVPVALLVAAPVLGLYFDRAVPWLALPFLLVASGLALLAARLLWADEAGDAILPAIGAAVALYIGAIQFAVPALTPFSLSQRLAAAAYGAGCEAPIIGTVGYREPSLVLLTSTNLEMPPDGAAGARFIGGSGCRVALVEARDETAFRQELLTIGVRAERVGDVEGLNLNGGRVLDIGVWLKR